MLFFFLKKFLVKTAFSLIIVSFLVGLVTCASKGSLRAFFFFSPELLPLTLLSVMNLVIPLSVALGLQQAVAEIVAYTDMSILHLLKHLLMIIRKSLYLFVFFVFIISYLFIFFIIPNSNLFIKKIIISDTKRIIEMAHEGKIQNLSGQNACYFKKKTYEKNGIFLHLVIFLVQEKNKNVFLLRAEKASLHETRCTFLNGSFFLVPATSSHDEQETQLGVEYSRGSFSSCELSLEKLFFMQQDQAFFETSKYSLRVLTLPELIRDRSNKEIYTELHRRILSLLWIVVISLGSFFGMLFYGVKTKRPSFFGYVTSGLFFLLYYADLLRLVQQEFSLFLFYGPLALFCLSLILLCLTKKAKS